MQAMERIWGQGEHVQCMHPQAPIIAGREMVSPETSWSHELFTLHLEWSLMPSGAVERADSIELHAADASGWFLCGSTRKGVLVACLSIASLWTSVLLC